MDIERYAFTGDQKFDIKKFDPSDGKHAVDKEEAQSTLKEHIDFMEAYQDRLYAEGKHAVLIIFQAMDAAGKDGAIKHVFSGLNPQGVEVFSFKQPSAEELAHGYLWRAHKCMPPRGKIAIFNRSYYEDVLVAKVHKLYLAQNLPDRCKDGDVIANRYVQIRHFEHYAWENGTTIIKFFLHVSKGEQKKRFLDRIDDPSKNWKFSESDFVEREYWDDYQDAYEKAINETATPDCPWYVIPSDDKWHARFLISKILMKHIKQIDPQYPELPQEAADKMHHWRKLLLD